MLLFSVFYSIELSADCFAMILRWPPPLPPSPLTLFMRECRGGAYSRRCIAIGHEERERNLLAAAVVLHLFSSAPLPECQSGFSSALNAKQKKKINMSEKKRGIVTRSWAHTQNKTKKNVKRSSFKQNKSTSNQRSSSSSSSRHEEREEVAVPSENENTARLRRRPRHPTTAARTHTHSRTCI